MLVDNVLMSVLYGVRYIIFKNPFIQIMGSVFRPSSISILKVSAGLCMIYITFKALGKRRRKVFFSDFIFTKLSLNFPTLIFLEVIEEDSQPKIKGCLQKQRKARTGSCFS